MCELSCMDPTKEIAILYLLAASISFLLAISEALGLSGARANSISELIIGMIKARINKDQAEPVTETVPVITASKSTNTETSSWST